MSPDRLVAGTFFTQGWCYCSDSWLEHFSAAVDGATGVLVVVTDESDECMEKVRGMGKKLECFGWTLDHVRIEVKTDRHECYKEDAQLVIARLQQAAFSRARELGANLFWSVEADVLVPPNSLRVLRQALEFDNGYYGISMGTYFNGQFLGGRGTPQQHICEDFLEKERVLTPELAQKVKKREKEIKTLQKQKKEPSQEQVAEWEKISEQVKACPPRGNIFKLQSRKWRKRGWLESAYPAVGRGAILPTDWVGLGCTLINKKALLLATFEGYELKGTQDLFLCWSRWNPAGIRMCVVPHIVCHHVKRMVDKDGKRGDEITIYEAQHEISGEYEGHLRCRPRKYFDFNRKSAL